MTVKEIYGETIRAYGKQPDDSQLKAWKQHFSHFEPQYLISAIQDWQAQIEIDDFTHKPKGSMFPQIADLLTRAKTIKARAEAGDKFVSCGKCTSSGFLFVKVHGIAGEIENAVKRCTCFIDWSASRGRQVSEYAERNKALDVHDRRVLTEIRRG